MPLHDTPDSIPTKQCSKCRRWLPATFEVFSRRNERSSGLRSQCKECERKWRGENKAKIAQQPKRRKVANPEKFLEAQRRNQSRWREVNHEKERERERIRRLQNLDEVRAKKAIYQRKWRAANPEKASRARRKYATANPEKIRMADHRRRAREQKADGAFVAADIKRQYEAQKGKCYWCGIKVGRNYHVDHIVPLSRGGSNDPHNLVIACPFCNRSKGTKLPHEWDGSNRLL